MSDGLQRVPGVSARLLVFVTAKFPLARKRQLDIDDPLLEAGLVDSLGVLDLVNFIEKEFGVQLADEELVPERFRTLRSVGQLVESKLAVKAKC